MPNHIKFPSIDQFRSVVKWVRDNANYHAMPYPTIKFIGTVKLHGTCFSACQDTSGEIYIQSRERIITPDDDNAGACAWAFGNIDKLKAVFDRVRSLVDVQPDDIIQISGEWCGGNIQKGVGINHVAKQLIVFAIRVSRDSEQQLFLSNDIMKLACGSDLDCIVNYKMWEIDIDFNHPEIAQNTMIEITQQVERDCPVARQQLGSDFAEPLIGEGVVWTTWYKDRTLRFKVKGELHSITKVKTLASVDIERVNSIQEFVESVVTENRLQQGLEHVPEREPQYVGNFIKWVVGDVIKEESDTMEANGFTNKDVSSKIANVARKWFLDIPLC